MNPHASSAEKKRLNEFETRARAWKMWGPYLSDRQWGTVREDYSGGGTAWDYFPHEHARSRAYRWGEDGIAGISDRAQHLCFAPAFWNGRDRMIKERLFGLNNAEGNHGEDVKELYYYLDATPTHSYLKMLYKYPQAAFPYEHLVEQNQRRGKSEPEYELLDTGLFDEDRYFDIFVEYAMAAPEDILVRITAHNRGPDDAVLHVLPTLWFRNTWSWKPNHPKPSMRLAGSRSVLAEHPQLGDYRLFYENKPGTPEPLFCDNETNFARVFGNPPSPGVFKDGFHDYLIESRHDAVNPNRTGTKAALHYSANIATGGSVEFRFRLVKGFVKGRPMPADPEEFSEQDTKPDDPDEPSAPRSVGVAFDPAGVLSNLPPSLQSAAEGATTFIRHPFADFNDLFAERVKDADDFYAELQNQIPDRDERLIHRQALAGMIWSKQFFYYDVREWLKGDPTQPPPPAGRKHGRNADWQHLVNADIISMPDKWEYPWYAAWDLAFHCIPLAQVDPGFAKRQLIRLTREWYMHPNGQLPAYEWAFGDVNPPVHAWAAWRVFQIDRKQRGDHGDIEFLERVFHKLMLNFTWWVNRKDAQGRNIFQGGFLGLDNIGVFDRSSPLPTGGFINQADGTSWMAMYSLNLMRIALELALHNPVYEDVATKFFEHFLHIAAAINGVGEDSLGLWDEQDEFYYDHLSLPDGQVIPLKVRSLVGLIPLLAVETLDPALLERVPDFTARLNWFFSHRPDLAGLVSRWNEAGAGERQLLSLLRGHRMKCLLRRMLDETEFLSPYGIRGISQQHRDHPYRFEFNGTRLDVPYWPAESESGLFGGNSNWRGPIWMPMNFLLIESLQKFHHYYGNDFKIECPTGSGKFMTINEVANELSARLIRLFQKNDNGIRPVLNYHPKLANDPHFRDHILFHEYFHGDNGRGVGASHQTGWTGLVAKLIRRHADDSRDEIRPKKIAP